MAEAAFAPAWVVWRHQNKPHTGPSGCPRPHLMAVRRGQQQSNSAGTNGRHQPFQIAFGQNKCSDFRPALLSIFRISSNAERISHHHVHVLLDQSHTLLTTTDFCSPLSDALHDPGPTRLLGAQVSPRTVSPTLSDQQQQLSNSQPPRSLSKAITQQPPPTLPKPPSDLQPQPPPTLPKPPIQAPQTHLKLQTFSQPLPKPYLQTPPKPQAPPQTPPKPQALPQALVKSHSLTLDQSGDLSRPSVLPGDPLSPTESGDTLSDEMSSKQMSIKER